MKKSLLIFCVLVILVVFCFAIIYISNSETSYAKKLDFEDEQVLAVFYIGGTSDTYDYSLVEKYFGKDSIENFKEIKIEGEEKYLIVPRYKGKVEVHSLTLNGEDIENNLIEIVDQPFYIVCNASDIFPNSRIKLETRTGESVYTPYISLKDGSVVVTDNVLLQDK